MEGMDGCPAALKAMSPVGSVQFVKTTRRQRENYRHDAYDSKFVENRSIDS